MKTLLDENMPQSLTPAFDEAWHVNELGWQGKKNGALLRAARDEGFEVLVTTDVSIYNQQKAQLYGMAILILRVYSNAPAGIRPLIKEAQASIDQLQLGDVEYIYVEARLRESDKRRSRGEFAE